MWHAIILGTTAPTDDRKEPGVRHLDVETLFSTHTKVQHLTQGNWRTFVDCQALSPSRGAV